MTQLVDYFRERGAEDVSELRTVDEDVRFMLPKQIREQLGRAGLASRAGSGRAGGRSGALQDERPSRTRTRCARLDAPP